MTKRQLVSILGAAIMLTAVSGTAIFAQTQEVATPETTPVPPASFTDGRINGSTDLGGLALFCVDKNNNTHVNTFQNGAITVWGVADQKYINLSAAQLRGNVEIPQMPSEMEMQMTEEASSTMAATEMATEESTETDEVASTPMVPGQAPILLARAATPNGEVGFFTMGGDEFALQGYDENGKFFTYTWTGCSTGNIDTSAAAYLPDVTVQATPMMSSTDMMTPEATASS